MPEVSVELKQISTEDLATAMEEMNRDEEANRKEWEALPDEQKSALEQIVSEMIIGMTKDFEWLPYAVKFDPDNPSYLDINFKILLKDTVARAIQERAEELQVAEEARTGAIKLLEDIKGEK